MDRACRAGLLTVGLLAGIAGCHADSAKTSTSRSQAAEDVTEKDALATVGQKTVVGNMEPIPVHGVGLVYNLKGTGSSPPPGEHRAALENAILKRKGNPKDLLDAPGKTTSLVFVSAAIPPGAKAGDPLDVHITLPPGSKTTSLKGGILYPCDLTNVEFAGNLRTAMANGGMPTGKAPVLDGNTPLTGHRLAVAEGPLVAGSTGQAKEGSDEPPQLKAGRIWGGAKNLLDRPYYFVIADDNPQPRLAMVAAERLNTTFHAAGDGFGKVADAKVQGKPLVMTTVPPAYRLNHARFLLVARQVPLIPTDTGSAYYRQLEHDLVRPETTLTAAIKLEALGADSRQSLRVGLQAESPWVRFASAEALAYLGHPDGAKDLAELAEKHPSLRSHCLTALASMDDAVCLDQLVELMKKGDASLRYGAFHALRSADKNHDAVRGRNMNNSFWLHRVAPESEPMVHVAVGQRAEIVVYGTVCPMKAPFSFPVGSEFTVAAKEGSDAVTVTRLATKNGELVAVPVQCRADLPTVLAAVAEMGGTYTEAVELIRRAEQADALTAAVAYDSTPRGLSLNQLAQIARSDPSLDRADLEVQRSQRGDVVPASYELPTDADAVKAKPVEPAGNEGPALNRQPGKLFGK